MSILEAIAFGGILALASSAHCAGMCGVFALRVAAARAGGRALGRLLTYTLGKTCTYVFLGALAGSLGAGILVRMRWSQALLGAAAGTMLLLTAWRLLRGRPATGVTGSSRLGRLLAGAFGGLPSAGTLQGSFSLGLVTGAIPCGVVYVALLEGAASASPGTAVLLMGVLGLGTIPVLILVGTVGSRVAASTTSRRLRLAAGGAVLLLAGLTLYRALMPLIQQVGPGETPCCH